MFHPSHVFQMSNVIFCCCKCAAFCTSLVMLSVQSNVSFVESNIPAAQQHLQASQT
jgi:hypothetical protein